MACKYSPGLTGFRIPNPYCPIFFPSPTGQVAVGQGGQAHHGVGVAAQYPFRLASLSRLKELFLNIPDANGSIVRRACQVPVRQHGKRVHPTCVAYECSDGSPRLGIPYANLA